MRSREPSRERFTLAQFGHWENELLVHPGLWGCLEPVTSGRRVARIVGPRTMSAVHFNFVDSNFWPLYLNLWFWRYLLVSLLLMFVIRSPYGCWGRGWEPKLCPWSVVAMIDDCLGISNSLNWLWHKWDSGYSWLVVWQKDWQGGRKKIGRAKWPACRLWPDLAPNAIISLCSYSPLPVNGDRGLESMLWEVRTPFSL